MTESIRKLLVLAFFAISIPFLSAQKANAAEVFFSQVYKGVGNTYGEETSAITISTSTQVAGTNFSFVSYDPANVQFNGNNVVGYLKYIDASGNPVSILVNATRPVKAGATAQGLYFVAIKVDANGNALDASNNIIADPANTQNSLQYTGDAYTFVLFGQETYFSTNTSIGTSSDRVDSFLNGLLSQPKINAVGTFTAFSSCAGSASTPQSVTVDGQNLGSSPITVTAPTGYEVSLTSGSGYAASVSIAAVSGTVTTTTVYMRLSATAITGATGSLVFSATGVADRIILSGTATVNALPTVTVSPASANIVPSGNVSLTASGATTYAWSPSTGLSSTSGATVTASPASTTTYTVTGTTSGCSSSTTVVVTVGAALTGGTVGSNQTICKGSSPASLTVSTAVSGGTSSYTYQWQSSSDNITFNDIPSATSSTYAPGVLNATTYYKRKVNDGLNTAYSNVITITVNSASAPTISGAGAITQPTCAISTGSIDLGGLPASGTWTVTATPGGATITGSGTTSTFSGLAAGTYTFAVTNAAGCTSAASSPATINVQPATPSAPSLGTITQPTCAVATGSISLGGLPATGTWTVTASPGGATISGTGTTGTFTNVPPGTYTVIVTNDAGCSSASSPAATINAQPVTPSAPAAITGKLRVIAGTTQTYSIAADPNATSYAWTLSTGWTGSSTSTTISVVAGTSTGTISVVANSATCTSPATSITVVIVPDYDGDGLADEDDLDDDNDGILDTVENAICSPSSDLCDTDGDGIPNKFDLDSDGDGITDVLEANGTDADKDGKADGAIDANGVPSSAKGGLTPPDTDGDGKSDPYDVDSDGDGIPDKLEAQAKYVAPLGKDTDKDGIDDAYDKDNGGTPIVPVDTDKDGKPDFRDLDTDGDGIPDSVEKGADGNNPVDTDKDGTPDYRDLDSDNDGIPDSVEKGADGNNPVDTDKDGTPDYRDLDSDNDGIPDSVEKGADGNNPVDTDKDGIPDYRDLDSDNDGIPDSIEKGADGNNPVDTDKDGIPDYRDLDSDNDGIPDSVEKGANGNSPVDTDKDGIPDYRDLDSDNDGIPDSVEKGADGNNPVDTDKDGIPDYRDLDSDNDGIPDSVEKGADGNNPVDTDKDGIPDYRDLDSDNDGIPDSIEKGADGNNPVDTDKDGIPDFRDLDSDNDGIPDADEAGPDPTKPLDSDGDGIYDFRETDSTNDGIPDNETLLIFKTASSAPKLSPDGTFQMKYNITLRNARKEPLNNVQIKEDLTKTFPSPMDFVVLDVKSSGVLTKNSGFDGRTNTSLLASGVTLGGLGIDSVVLTIKILPNGYAGAVNNTAEGTATAKWFTVTRQSIDTTASNGRKHGAGLPTAISLPPVDVKIPDVITPNGDGINDKFTILRPSNVKVNLMIYNRWGQLVYKNADYKNDWDGTSSGGFLGNQLPQGTYFYLVELSGGSYTTKAVKKGYLTLKRDY